MDPEANIEPIVRALREATLRDRRAEVVAQLAEIDRALASLGGGVDAQSWVLTSDPRFAATTGHTSRSVVDAIRRGELAATKATKGYRVDLAELRRWEGDRTARRRAQRSRRARVAPEQVPANDAHSIDRALAGAVRRSR